MEIREKLARWYNENRRDLPWRRSRDPYQIWISEIMLQQTTVTVVRPYFEKFIQAFPTVKALAQAKEERVLSHWSGLGYYSRARNLQKAAKDILARGEFPKTYNSLLELSGIGPYTAAAVASIAFNEEVPAIDGNVIRVITRLFDINSDVSKSETKILIEKHAAHLIKGQSPSIHNQAMMELGATMCTPKNPGCFICPVHSFCQARKAGTVELRPVKTKKRKSEAWVWQMNLVKNSKGQIALVKTENGTPWLNHLWVLPGIAKKWEEATEPKAHFKHSITHHKIYVQLRVLNYSNYKPSAHTKWMTPEQIEKVGVSSIVSKALKHQELL